MNTSQLHCCIECDPVLAGRIIGVYAADQLPKTVPFFPCGFIANTDDHTGSGRHWVAFYMPRSGLAEFFDSYGQPPSRYNWEFSQWLKRHCKTVRWNIKKMQSDFSNVCGLYCFYFLSLKLIGYSMDQIVRRFVSSDVRDNDHQIYDLFQHAYPHCFSNQCVYNQVCFPKARNL